jgi:hypothetical protein
VNVYFDNNVVAELARAGVDPVSALAGSEFVISVTPDLAAEYQQGINHEKVRPEEKELCRRLLAAATERGSSVLPNLGGGYSGFDHGNWATDSMSKTLQSVRVSTRPGKTILKNRTDAFLVALAEGAVVITNNLNDSHFKLARAVGHHVYSWAEISTVANAPSEVAHKLAELLVVRLSESKTVAPALPASP